MSTEIKDGPIHVYGPLGNILNAPGQGQAGSVLVPDPNDDAGPSLFYQSVGILDVRCFYGKDKVIGFPGSIPGHIDLPFIQSVDCIPATFQTNNIAAAQTVTNGVAMVAAAAATGITLNVPIIPFLGYGQIGSGAVVTTGMALDFGFAFGNCVTGNVQITVADSTQFRGGMPLVIGGVGNAAGTACLLTNVLAIVDATHITLTNAPAATNAAAPIGTGNNWPVSEAVNVTPTPTAAQPYMARGPGLFYDPQQAVQRGIQIAGTNAGCTGGTFLVTGYDAYSMLMTQLVTVAAGVATSYSLKSFKYIVSVVPQFTDVTVGHTYTVGTADMFGFAVRSDKWEYINVCWNGAFMTASQGWIAAVTTTPATNLTGDVRGTVQTSGQGGAGGGGIGTNNSNGTIVALAMSGRRLVMFQSQPLFNVINGTVTDTRTMYGVTQQ